MGNEELKQILLSLEMEVEDKKKLLHIRKKFKLDNERFAKGIFFVKFMIGGDSRTSAYSKAFNVEKHKAKTVATNFYNSKWVQEIVIIFSPDTTLKTPERAELIVARLMEVIEDENASDSEVIKAATVLKGYVIETKRPTEEEEEVKDTRNEWVDKLLAGIGHLSQQNKMISQEGDIIDVGVLE